MSPVSTKICDHLQL